MDNKLSQLCAALASFHGWPDLPEVRFLVSGTADVYEVVSRLNQYILKLYAPRTFSREELEHQGRLLHFLEREGVACAKAIAGHCGGYAGTLNDVHGMRHWLLFDRAEGEGLNAYSPSLIKAVGREIARLHVVGERFPPTIESPRMTTHWLIERPLWHIVQRMQEAGVNALEVEEIAHRIIADIDRARTEHNRMTIVHGDPHFSNVCITRSGLPILLDFDNSRLGDAIFDVAFIVLFANAQAAPALELVESFLEGYQAIRTVSAKEKRNLSPFMAAFQLLAMGRHCQSIGGKYPAPNRDYFVANMAALRTYGARKSFYAIAPEIVLNQPILGDTLASRP